MVIGLLWTLSGGGNEADPRAAFKLHGGADDAGTPLSPRNEQVPTEIIIEGQATETGGEGGGHRGFGGGGALSTETGETEGDETGGETGGDETGELEDEGTPTYPVWFESERGIGVCKINYEGGSKTANLHVSARLPEGKLSFSYRCGKHDGRGSISVKARGVNGVLFCKKDGSVKVKTVRRKDGRCAR